MNAHIYENTIRIHLTEMRARLEKALRIAKAAEACARSGRTKNGIEIAQSYFERAWRGLH